VNWQWMLGMLTGAVISVALWTIVSYLREA
jgi:hypothetical protein